MIRRTCARLTQQPSRRYQRPQWVQPANVPVINHISMTVITPNELEKAGVRAVPEGWLVSAQRGDVRAVAEAVRANWGKWLAACGVVGLAWVWQSAALARCEALVEGHVSSATSLMIDTEKCVHCAARNWTTRTAPIDSRIASIEAERGQQAIKLSMLTAALRDSLIATQQWQLRQKQNEARLALQAEEKRV